MTRSSSTSAGMRRVALAASAIGVSLALGIVGCGMQGGAKGAATTDSTLARDLALANADSAARPRLADTAAGPGAAVAAPKTGEAASEKRASEHHAAKHTSATASRPAPEPAAAPAPAPAPPPPPLVAPSGTSFGIVISDTVTTATAHVGDPISATVASDVTDASGTVVIPAGSRVHGSVTTSTGPAHTPHLGVAFSSVDVRGQSYPVQSNITALPMVQSRRTARAAQVGEVAGGAAVGGLLGRAIGGKKSGGTLIGALAGAAAGVAVADKTESHDAVLPKGAEVTLQLTSPITVPRS